MKIALLGDVAFFGINSNNEEFFKEKYEKLALILKSYDYVIANLETPLTESNSKNGYKSAYIKGNEKDSKMLKYLNITHVSLANNHIFDYGHKGLESTIMCLEKVGIEYFGVNGLESFIEHEDNKIALLGFCCYSTNGLNYTNKDRGIMEFNPEQVLKKMKCLGRKKILPVLSLHMGEEHVNLPNYDHLKIARYFAKETNYILHGHHPHVMQGIEEVGESLLAYSLGNFCFDDVYVEHSKEPLIKLSDNNKESAILEIEIEKNQIISYKMIPFRFESIGVSIGDNQLLSKYEDYNKLLTLEPSEYTEFRKEKLNDYLTDRIKKRNLKWYLKRLNYNYLGVYVKSKLNRKRYIKLIKEYVEDTCK